MNSNADDIKAPETPTGDGGAATQVLAAPNPPPKKKELSGKQVALILGTLVIVAGTIIAIVLLTRPKEAAVNRIIDDANVNEIQEDMQSRVDQGMFETYMTTSWTFPNGEAASSDAVMGNSVNNNYPFWFELLLSDTGEVLFESGLLPVGTTIESITLNKDLPAGTYRATVAVHLMDENGDPIDSNAAFNVTLKVLS
jgi:hypothetical protein